MIHGMHVLDGMSVQDRDLLLRLTQYFETLETRAAQGQGWFIFNAGGQRAAWLTRFIQARLAEYRPLISYYFMPWRDFALNAYMTNVELPAHGEPTAGAGDGESDRLQREYRLASGVARATGFQMRQCDALVLSGVRPTREYEVALLDDTIGQRHLQRRATLLLTPLAPHHLGEEIARLETVAGTWQRIWERMYERSLVAL
jgi:hypothetical protein